MAARRRYKSRGYTEPRCLMMMMMMMLMAATSRTALDSSTPCSSMPLAGALVLVVLGEASCARLAVGYANVAALVLRGFTGWRTR